MEELAIKGEAMEQEIMPSFDFLLKDGVFYDVDHLAILKEEWAGYLGF